MIDTILLNLSNSKLFSGCIMLMTNIGGRYLAQEMPDNVEKIFSKYTIIRYLVLFSVFFMATRDIKTSILLSLLFFIVIKFFVNEKSTFCVVNDIKIEKKITPDEAMRAKDLLEKYKLQNA
jgi:hypothetical protein